MRIFLDTTTYFTKILPKISDIFGDSTRIKNPFA